jgi:hypothetical protein
VQENAKVAVAANPKTIKKRFVWCEGKIGEDMNFSWVNKDNILGFIKIL